MVKSLLQGNTLGRILHQHSAYQIFTTVANKIPLTIIEYQLPIDRLLTQILIVPRTKKHVS
jgi:hypothetical protein